MATPLALRTRIAVFRPRDAGAPPWGRILFKDVIGSGRDHQDGHEGLLGSLAYCLIGGLYGNGKENGNCFFAFTASCMIASGATRFGV